MSRQGFCFFKLVVALAVIATVNGLSLPAVSQIREAANRSRSLNNLRQIAIAIANFDSNFGKFPSAVDWGPGAPTGFGVCSLHFQVLPYIEGSTIHQMYQQNNPQTAYNATGACSKIFKPYLSPADPSAPEGKVAANEDVSAPGATEPFQAKFSGHYATTSYPVNGLLYVAGNGFKTMIDGSASTISIAERYQVCKSGSGATAAAASGPDTYTLWGMGAYSSQTAAFALKPPSADDNVPVQPKHKNVMFVPKDSQNGSLGAQGYWADDPKTKVAFTARTIAGAPGGFQVAPRGDVVCDSRVPNTPHSSGMLVAMGDGSTRTVKPTISAHTFWKLVTPAGSEIIDPNW